MEDNRQGKGEEAAAAGKATQISSHDAAASLGRAAVEAILRFGLRVYIDPSRSAFFAVDVDELRRGAAGGQR